MPHDDELLRVRRVVGGLTSRPEKRLGSWWCDSDEGVTKAKPTPGPAPRFESYQGTDAFGRAAPSYEYAPIDGGSRHRPAIVAPRGGGRS